MQVDQVGQPSIRAHTGAAHGCAGMPRVRARAGAARSRAMVDGRESSLPSAIDPGGNSPKANGVGSGDSRVEGRLEGAELASGCRGRQRAMVGETMVVGGKKKGARARGLRRVKRVGHTRPLTRA